MESPFLSLVRLGIGKPVNSLPHLFDWSSIYAIAAEQGLSAIIIDGIEKLPEQLHPPKTITLQWIGEVLQNYETRYQEYGRSIAKLAKFYHRYDIKMMVLKGYGLSLYYPIPNHRPCGDIDIWNFGKQKEADSILSKKTGIPVDASEHHHTIFYWDGFMVENHYDILITSSAKANKYLEPILKELAMDASQSIEINDDMVYLPSANFNALFLFRHMLMHFVACGINLRMILDWAFFWEKEGKGVDKEWLKEIVERYHMSAFFNIINAICVHDLGFDASVFPSIQCNPEQKEKVLNDTLCPEYDWRDAHKRGLLKRILFKYRRWRSGAWKRELCYGESHWVSFWTSVWSHLLKPASI